MIQELGKEESWTQKSPYEWCLEFNVRPFEPQYWNMTGLEDRLSNYSFHASICTKEEFLEELECHDHKENSRPRKMDELLEMKMYGLVIYQLMGIQQGIQFQHAVTDYGRSMETMVPLNNAESAELKNRYQRWADKWKTSIILNGGTTNSGDCEDFGIGSLQKHLIELRDNGVHVDTFCEPDLNNAMTAICFIADERVFLKDDYPSFEPTPKPYAPNYTPNAETIKAWEDDNARNYKKWVEKVGGPKNAFLREFLTGKRLA